MRRHLAAVAALGTTLFLAAGCSDDAASSTTATTPATGSATGIAPAPVDPAVAASADAALSGNTKAICDQAARAGTGFGETYLADLKLKIEAAGKGAAAQNQAQQKLVRDVENYSFALGDMAKLTKNAPLKKALNKMSKEVTALKGDVTKINADKMSALSGTLDKACGKG